MTADKTGTTRKQRQHIFDNSLLGASDIADRYPSIKGRYNPAKKLNCAEHGNSQDNQLRTSNRLLRGAGHLVDCTSFPGQGQRSRVAVITGDFAHQLPLSEPDPQAAAN
jgi:hypothetical protein